THTPIAISQHAIQIVHDSVVLFIGRFQSWSVAIRNGEIAAARRYAVHPRSNAYSATRDSSTTRPAIAGRRGSPAAVTGAPGFDSAAKPSRRGPRKPPTPSTSSITMPSVIMRRPNRSSDAGTISHATPAFTTAPTAPAASASPISGNVGGGFWVRRAKRPAIIASSIACTTTKTAVPIGNARSSDVTTESVSRAASTYCAVFEGTCVPVNLGTAVSRKPAMNAYRKPYVWTSACARPEYVAVRPNE